MACRFCRRWRSWWRRYCIWYLCWIGSIGASSGFSNIQKITCIILRNLFGLDFFSHQSCATGTLLLQKKIYPRKSSLNLKQLIIFMFLNIQITIQKYSFCKIFTIANCWYSPAWQARSWLSTIRAISWCQIQDQDIGHLAIKQAVKCHGTKKRGRITVLVTITKSG